MDSYFILSKSINFSFIIQLISFILQFIKMHDYKKMDQYMMNDNLECNCFGANTLKSQPFFTQPKIISLMQLDNKKNIHSPSNSSIVTLKHMFKKSLKKQHSSHDLAEQLNQIKPQNTNLQFNKTHYQIHQQQLSLQSNPIKPEMKRKTIQRTPFYKQKESLKIILQSPIKNVQYNQPEIINKNYNNSLQNIESNKVYVNYPVKNTLYKYPEIANQSMPQINSGPKIPVINFSFPKQIKSSPLLKECNSVEQKQQFNCKAENMQDKLVHIQQLVESQTDGIQIKFEDEIAKYFSKSPQTPSKIQSKQYKSEIITKQAFSQSKLNSINDNIVLSQINTKKSLVNKKQKKQGKQSKVSLKRMQDVQEIQSVPDSDNISVSDKESIVLGRMNHGSMVQPKIHYSTDLSHLSSIHNKMKQK